MVKLVSVSSVEEALIIRGVLESNGIQVNIPNEQHASIDWAMIPALGGLAIQVPDDRLDEARQLLADLQAETASDDEVALEDNTYFENRAEQRRGKARSMLVIYLAAPVIFLIAGLLWSAYRHFFVPDFVLDLSEKFEFAAVSCPTAQFQNCVSSADDHVYRWRNDFNIYPLVGFMKVIVDEDLSQLTESKIGFCKTEFVDPADSIHIRPRTYALPLTAISYSWDSQGRVNAADTSIMIARSSMKPCTVKDADAFQQLLDTIMAAPHAGFRKRYDY